MSKVILLTGATGFVGGQILKALIHQNIYKIRLVVRECEDYPVDPSLKIEKIIQTPDLFTEKSHWWADVCEGVDTVIHCAWYTVPGKYLQSSKNIDCLIGTLNLAKGAAKAGIRLFIGVGTCFEYDLKLGVLSTDVALKPLTPYAAAKASAYTELSQYFSSGQIEFAWCRLFYLYGKGEHPRRLVPYIHGQLSAGDYAELTGGTQIRDFLDVEEAGVMIAEVAQSGTRGAINICSGIPITIRQLAEQIADEYGRRDLLKFGTRPDNQIDPPCVVGVKTVLVA